ncbi:MAG: sulfatase [Phycisphaerales bacterium]|nr:sulfatase [Phycisphaerales bacterium]
MPPPPPLNVLYIHSHDTGRLIQPYGHCVPTPNLQALAEGGVLFRQAFCAAPTCSPSRAALLTGLPPHEAGIFGLAHRGFELHPEARKRTLPAYLATHGYQTVLADLQHITAGPLSGVGYQHILPKNGWGVTATTQAATNYLRSQPTQPFFLDVGFFATHRHGPEFWPASNTKDGQNKIASLDHRYLPAPPGLPDTAANRLDFADFRHSAGLLDAGIGQVLAALDEANLTGNTLILATTDHGPPFPRMKCNLTAGGMGVMLILRGPGGWTGGRTTDALVSHIDIFPTICESLGLPPPPWLRGRSLTPLAKDTQAKVNDAIFGEITYHAAYEPVRSVRTHRWNYLKRYDKRGRPVWANTDDSPGKLARFAANPNRRDPPAEALYDLLFDPHEMDNRLTDPACAEILREMRQRLTQWQQATGDPLLTGDPIPLGPNAAVNSPDAFSPEETPTLAKNPI